ncbi:MAG: condensation domain-containing protein, partial [Caldilineales bacterium]|nr:condensation domain-containing protein [Caldilineales bacterium]
MTNPNVADLYPLSPMQQGMLFHSLLAPETGVYVEQMTATLRGALDVAAFRQAWQRVMDRHPILRTAFVWQEVEEPLQFVQRQVPVPLEELDWRGRPAEEQAAAVEAFCAADRARGFDLGRPPLLRLTLIRLADDVHELVWTHHHALLDGWSLPILLKEVFTFYEAARRGKLAALPAARPYRDYIAWLKRQDMAAAEAFWRRTLAGFTAPTPLPVARPADPGQPQRVAEQEVWLDAEATAALQATARALGVTLNTLVAAAWGLLLSRYADADDVVFGATVSGRPADLRGAEGMVGLFINTLPVRVRVAEDQPLGRWLQAFQAQQAELRQYEHTPLVQVQGWSDLRPRDLPLFESILVFENYPADRALAEQLSAGGQSLAIERVRSREQTNYPLTFVAGGTRELMLKLSYDVRRFDDEAIGRMLGHLRTLLIAMPSHVDRPVAELPLLPPAEVAQLLAWGGAGPAAGRDGAWLGGVHELFAAQAARTPDAVAVVWEGKEGKEGNAGKEGKEGTEGTEGTGGTRVLTYAELEVRANQLARHLMAQGVQPGETVGLLVERSPDLIVGLLGILKAGAAYLPLDPAFPPERIAFMLADSGTRVVVTQERVWNSVTSNEVTRNRNRDGDAAASAELTGNVTRNAVTRNGSREEHVLSAEGLAHDGSENPVTASAVTTKGEVSASLHPTLPSLGYALLVTHCIFLDRELLVAQQPTVLPAVSITPDGPAYVIYTSGSTGTPKGVVVSHGNLANHARAMAEVFAIGPGDCMLQFITASFDAAGEEFYPALISGATLALPGDERDRLGVPLAEFCERCGVNYIHLPASVWHQWCDDLAAAGWRWRMPHKVLLVGGESPSPERLAVWNALLPRPCRFINAYGPTEATITTALYETGSDAPLPPRVPIGRPIANAQVYAVDRRGRLTPIGVPGELLIGGAGVALGYLGRPDLTAERFLPNPFAGISNQLSVTSDQSDDRNYRSPFTDHRSPITDHRPPITAPRSALPAPRLYKTGDLVRWLPDGNLEFLGRVDDQVKIRGFRVELGEVEAALASLPGVRQAAVVAHPLSSPSSSSPSSPSGAPDRRLVAYVAAEDGADLEALRAALRRRLPDYMVPSLWVRLPSLPMTPTGKVDRRALPVPDVAALVPAFVAPRTPEETLLAEMMADLLRVERVGAHDNFFELGGHSLLATRLASRIQEVFGVEVPLRALFDAPTVAGMAAAIGAARAAQQARPLAAGPIPRLPRGADGLPLEPPPLSFGQQRLWFLDQLEPGLLAYNTPAVLRLRGRLDVDALRRSLNEVIRRHEVLRTAFDTVDGRPAQVIAPALALDLPLDDLSSLPDAAAREAEAMRRVTEEVRRPFDLSRGPLIRGRLLRLAEDDHIAVVTVHHIAADGWSLGVLTGELAALYQADVQGLPADLPPLPLQYADYAAWQRRWLEGGDGGPSPLEAQLAYWREQLAGLPPRLELPTDRPRPPVQTSNGSVYTFRLPADLSERLIRLSRDEGVTLYMTLLAGYQTLLARYANQADVAVGSVVANRPRPELEGLVGFFVNTLVFRTRFDGDPTFRELLARVRETVLAAFAHADVPFEMLVDAIQPQRDLSHTPLFQAAFSLQNTPMPSAELPGLSLQAINVDRGAAQFDMLLTVAQTPEGLAASWEYNTDLFDRSTIERMARHLQNLLAAAVADPDRPALDLPLMDAEELQRILVAWNDTAAPFPDNTTIHALIEAQAAAQPDAPAAIFALPGGPAETLTYGELDRRANQLAHYLQRLGVGPNTLVGLLTERSLDMVVGILGILKAGGAYLPVDPAYPPDRIAFMLEDSGVRVLVTKEDILHTAYAAHGTDHAVRSTQYILLDRDWPAIAQHPPIYQSTNLPASDLPTADTLAYCIYTSGSTGRPKGTLLRHRGLCNLADVQQRAFDIRPGKRILQFSPLSFDASVWEFVMALRNGANLVLTRQEVLASGPALMRLLREQRITTVTLPPSLLAVLQPEELPDLETVIAAGERCTDEIVAKWAPGRRFFNAYGPTETTVCASMFRCDPAVRWPFGGPPIGGPIANFQLYVVDERLQPQPIGVPGELLIGGV